MRLVWDASQTPNVRPRRQGVENQLRGQEEITWGSRLLVLWATGMSGCARRTIILCIITVLFLFGNFKMASRGLFCRRGLGLDRGAVGGPLALVRGGGGRGVPGRAGSGEAAITAAERAAVTLRKMSSQERREMLEALAAGVKACQEELAQTIVAEGGKPITYARGEVSRGVMTLSLAAEEAARLGGEVLPLDLTRASAGRWGITRRFPVGPVLGITPFNFPFNLVAHKVGPALAAGNPIIIKPSSACPLTALKLAEVWDQAGLPVGRAAGAPQFQPPGRGRSGR